MKELEAYLFKGIENRDPAEKLIKEMVSGIEQSHEAVLSLHEKLLTGPTSVSIEISAYQEKIEQLHKAFSSMTTSAIAEHDELKQFYEKIFGTKIEGEDAHLGGLKQELDSRLEQLNHFETEQRTRHDTIFKKIESLLPGANSAGLASAYKALKDKFDTPISNYTKAFYGSLGILLLGGLTIVVDSVTLSPFQIEFLQASSWEEMLRTLITRAPIVVPAVWLAIFSATRRSQYERLQQEYAHKEAFSSSYESYKKQLQDLKVDADALQKELIGRAIEAIAYNASTTLDGNHTEKLPILQILDKLNVEELKKLMTMTKGS